MSVHLTPRQRLLALVLTPLLILGVVAGIWAATRQSPIVQRPVTQGDLPAGIPTHFSFGVESGLHGTADLNDMRTRNGTAWEARYQYLAAGVNTGATAGRRGSSRGSSPRSICRSRSKITICPPSCTTCCCNPTAPTATAARRAKTSRISLIQAS